MFLLTSLIEVEGGDSSGISEKVETPQEAKRTRRLGLARGKRPTGTEINMIDESIFCSIIIETLDLCK